MQIHNHIYRTFSAVTIGVIGASLMVGSVAFAEPNANASDQAFSASAGEHSNAQVCLPEPGVARCHARVVTDKSGAPSTSATPAGYGPAQFLKGYNLSGVASGHPVLAIVDAYDDPNIVKDLATYSNQFKIPSLPQCVGPVANSGVACFQKLNQNGGTVYPASNAGWALEISLDVEMAHALCQNCSILLVEANSATLANLGTAENQAVLRGASMISNSYGASEFSTEPGFDSNYNHPGVAITFSSGDGGYNNGNGVEYPAASPYVTAVGGTSLYLNSDSSYNHESAWSGAGSGCSIFEIKPTWQTDSLCAKRTVADVSADADPNTGAAVYDSVRYQGRSGWFQVGGTSLASPIIAATYALGGVTAGISENSLPYANAAGNLNDIITGKNGSCGGTYLCTAVAGYDGPTGLGTPHGAGAF